jgi:hypothetical protein
MEDAESEGGTDLSKEDQMMGDNGKLMLHAV